MAGGKITKSPNRDRREPYLEDCVRKRGVRLTGSIVPDFDNSDLCSCSTLKVEHQKSKNLQLFDSFHLYLQTSILPTSSVLLLRKVIFLSQRRRSSISTACEDSNFAKIFEKTIFFVQFDGWSSCLLISILRPDVDVALDSAMYNCPWLKIG